MSLPRGLHKRLIIRGFVSVYCMSFNLTKSRIGNPFRTVHIVYNHLDHNFFKCFYLIKAYLYSVTCSKDTKIYTKYLRK